MRRDSFASPPNSVEALSAPEIGLETDRRAAPRLYEPRRHVLEACSGRCHRYACRIHQRRLWIYVESYERQHGNGNGSNMDKE